MAFVFPVIGTTTWSPGSWMPYTQTHRNRTHAAIDIYAKRGQMIVSPVGGKVKNFGTGNIGGNWIQITGDDGNVYYFAHMDQAVTLKKGQRVSGGQQIGLVGNSGSARTTSTHLHFSVKRNGKAISPVAMLQSGIVVPDLEFEKTGVKGESGQPPSTPVDGPTFEIVTPSFSSEPLPPQAQQGTPAWFDQLEAYRKELRVGPKQENPKKIQARRVMHGTLRGMANLVRSAGFATYAGDGTGIDEVNTIGREPMSRETSDREGPGRGEPDREAGDR